MFNLFQRLSGISSLAMTVAIGLSLLIAITTPLLSSPAREQSIKIHKIQNTKGNVVDYYDRSSRKAEHLRLTLDVAADLTPLFNWNTKLLFAYVTVDFDDSSSGFTNSVAIWDRIITSKKKARINLRKMRNKYRLRNYGLDFKNVRSANITLHVNPVPYLGVMYDTVTYSIPFDIPVAEPPR